MEAVGRECRVETNDAYGRVCRTSEAGRFYNILTYMATRTSIVGFFEGEDLLEILYYANAVV